MMPINLPNIPDGWEVTKKDMRAIKEHLYELHEVIRYLFSHIDTENLTDELAAKIEEGGANEALTRRVEDAEGNIASIRMDANGIRMEVSDIVGDISKIVQWSNKIVMQVTDIVGNISVIEQTAGKIQSQVENLQGDISQVAQTAGKIQLQVTNMQGDMSKIDQKADGIQAKVTSMDGSISKIDQKADGINLLVAELGKGVASLSLTTEGLKAAVDNHRLAFTKDGLTIQNAKGETVFKQDNTTGNLDIIGIIRALGGTIGGFKIDETTLSNGNNIVLDSAGKIRLGNLTISDSTSLGKPVLEATNALYFIIESLYMALENNRVTMQKPVYALPGLFVSSSRTTPNPPNAYIDRATGELMLSTYSGSGSGGGTGGDSGGGSGPDGELGQTGYTTGTNVYMRSGPGISFSEVTMIRASGTAVQLYKQAPQNGWYRIYWNGYSGWIRYDYLSF